MAAERLYRQALELYGQTLSEHHVWTSFPTMGLGLMLLRGGRVTEAEELLRDSVETRRRVYDAGNWRTAEAECYLGSALTALGRLEEARKLLKPCAAILEQELGTDAQRTVVAQRALKELKHASGEQP